MKLGCRQLGWTGLSVSEISFGAGPVAGLLTRDDDRKLQIATVERAFEAGINWFDTAAAYGAGQSEVNLGRTLRDVCEIGNVQLATKVRVMPDQLDQIREAVGSSVAESLQRLGCHRITLLQLHNAITARRGAQPNSITPDDVLRPNGVLDAFSRLKSDGIVQYFGLTGLGEMPSLFEVIGAANWATIQIPWNILDIVDLTARSQTLEDASRSDLIEVCAEKGIGIIAIRVLAGGALAGRSPSAHTLSTPYFPLAIYQEDQARAERLSTRLPAGMALKEAAVRSVLAESRISTALIGFSNPSEIDEAVLFARAGALAPERITNLHRQAERTG